MSYETADTMVPPYAFSDFTRAFRQTAAGIEAIERADQRVERATASGFNIFRTLGVEKDEVHTHSALLANLLDPNGSHGQGPLFLRTFLTKYAEISPVGATASSSSFPQLSDEEIEEYYWHVETERVTARHGRLDIVVRCPRSRFLCVIENKIYAEDREGQLAGYVAWMQSQRTTYSKQALVYLTRCGKMCQGEAPDCYFTLSYRKHVARWLQDCLSNITSVRLRGVLTQYIELIETL